MFGEGEEGSVFFADVVEDPDGASRACAQANDFTPGAAEFALERLDALNGHVKMLFEESFENVYRHGLPPSRLDKSMKQIVF
jgi:hypothetical protein